MHASAMLLCFHVPEKNLATIRHLAGRYGIRLMETRPGDETMQIRLLLAGLHSLHGPNPEDGEWTQALLLMDGLDERQFNGFLDSLRAASPAYEGLKAIVTPTNRKWTVTRLMEDLLKERSAMEASSLQTTQTMSPSDRALMDRLDGWFDTHFEEILADLQDMVRVPSVAVYDEAPPYGEDCLKALKTMLDLGERYGLQGENHEDRYGSLLYGGDGTGDPGQEIAVWCHLDVVPPGDGWQLTEPFVPRRVGNWLIGRGADDNKGPAVGVLHVLRALRELGIQLRHPVRFFFGTDEEQGMGDVQYHAKHARQSALQIIADCGFPVCYGEKGVLTFSLVTRERIPHVRTACAGRADNIIPNLAVMELAEIELALPLPDHLPETVEALRLDDTVRLTAHGRSGHSAFPEGSLNAISELLSALKSICPEPVFTFLADAAQGFDGSALGLNGSDEVSGSTTCVPVGLKCLEDGRLSVRFNSRTCISADQEALRKHLSELCAEHGFTLEDVEQKPSSYFPPDHPAVAALTEACNAVTGLSLKPYVMAGGTYAKYLERALGFGFGGLMGEAREADSKIFAPGHGGCHMPDEGLYLPAYRQALTVFSMGLLAADRVLD